MRIMLWVGHEPNQMALAHKLSAQYNLVGIVAETRMAKRPMPPKKMVGKALERLLLPGVDHAWHGMRSYYRQQHAGFPDVALLDVENINDPRARRFSQTLKPDLVIVSGTRLVKPPMLALKPTIGIINLHTGLSPYVKGGPNCTNWCIAQRAFHLIGNTVMWIDEGIDTGNLVTTACTDIRDDESLLTLHIKVMEHAHALCLKAVGFLCQGKSSNVPQANIAKGKTYYTKQWTWREKSKVKRHFRLLGQAVRSGTLAQERKGVVVVTV